MNIQPGYESLAGVLQRALDQAQTGKGAERHANALPFDKQPMQTIAAQVGVGFLTGQAIKKTQEGQTLPAGRDVAELLGAINYLAGAVIFIEAQREGDDLDYTTSSPGVVDPVGENDNRKPPVVAINRLNECPHAALDMIERSVRGEKLRRKADQLQGRSNIDNSGIYQPVTSESIIGCGLVCGCGDDQLSIHVTHTGLSNG